MQAIAALRWLALHRSGDRRDVGDRARQRSQGSSPRVGMGKLGRLGLEPADRDERERPGEPIDIDVKKLGRPPAWWPDHGRRANVRDRASALRWARWREQAA